MILSKVLLDKISRWEENLTDVGDLQLLLDVVLRCAASYWLGLDEDDFCVQSLSGEGIVFGGLNRLVWTPARGFNPDKPYCTERFLQNWERIGPLPGRRTS